MPAEHQTPAPAFAGLAARAAGSTATWDDLDDAAAAEYLARTAAAAEAAARAGGDSFAAGLPARYQQITWPGTRDLEPPLPPATLTEIDTWARGADGNLLIFGPVGAGKTCLAVAAVRHAIDQGAARTALWLPARKIAALHRARMDGDRSGPNPDDLSRFDIVVIDDIGGTDLTDWETEKLRDVIAGRWEDSLVTVVTSNLDPAQPEPGRRTFASYVGERSYSRLRDGAVAVVVPGEDRRRPR